MLLPYGQHMRVQVRMPAAKAGNREGKAHHFIADECSDHLPADFLGRDEHSQWHQVSIGKIPDLLLQSDASSHLFELMNFANDDRLRAHLVSCSCCLARCHNDSS